MSTRKRRNNIRSVLLACTITSLAMSCATKNLAQDNTSFEAFCENGRSKKQYVFLVASYTGVPTKTPIDQVGKLIESQNKTNDYIINNFIKALTTLYYKKIDNPDDPQVIKNLYHYSTFAEKFQKGWFGALPHLAWVKDNLFAICEDGICNGMTFPEQPSVVITFDYQSWNDGRCADFFNPDGYISGLGCYGNANGLLSYLKDSGFNGGWLISENYLTLPENEQHKLCLKNEKEECVKTKDSSVQSIKKNSHEWMDLINKNGTKISTRVLDNWNLYRVTWDPSPICKYGRSNNDFYTH